MHVLSFDYDTANCILHHNVRRRTLTNQLRSDAEEDSMFLCPSYFQLASGRVIRAHNEALHIEGQFQAYWKSIQEQHI